MNSVEFPTPPKSPPGTPNPGQILGNTNGVPTVIDNIAKGVDPSPKEAVHVTPSPVGDIEPGTKPI